MDKKKIIAAVFVTAVILFIWIQSALPKGTSLNESSWLTESVINPVFRALFGKDLSVNTVRKVAHVVEFLALGLAFSALFGGNPWKTLLCCFAAAFIDESIQILSSRGPAILDVWIDMSGAALGMLIGFLVFRPKRRKGGGAGEDGGTGPQEIE